MRWGGYRGDWHWWFAWRPVKLGEDWLKRSMEWAWGEWIERRVERVGGWTYRTYRLPQERL